MAGVVDYDVVVVGSGFGGSVAALRLTEKGYRVGVLEAGRRFADEELATTSWQLREFLWAPTLGCYGIQRIHLLRDLVVLAGAGVGGGSLNYANTLYRPPDAFFRDPQWAHLADWRAELDTHYDQAQRMLGVTTYAGHTPADEVMQRVAHDMGVADTYHPTPVGVFFGRPGEEVDDPYFGGAGPRRTGCIECGSCMTGCRVGAKNTLVKNYLYLAERAGAPGGATVHPLTTVTALRPQADHTWLIDAVRTGKRWRRTIRASHVVLAAGTWGTQQLLHRMRDEGVLPRLSPRLGELTRTNSEAIVGAMRNTVDPQRDFSRGVAITSSFHPDEHTHIEPVRYGRGSNAMALLKTLATDGASDTPRWQQFLNFVVRHPVTMARLLKVRRWSERTVILLVMQNLDNSLTTYRRRGRLTSRPGHGEPNPTFIPAGFQASQLTARYIGGTAGSTWGELFEVPLTAHFLGGCPMSATAEDGVLDPYHRVHGYPTLSVVDGSAVSANLGVNPALTITALAERAFALWPNKGDPDPRPAPGESYRQLNPVPPGAPAVRWHS
ncbi:MAG: GMC family oxidoreductase [Actinomycetota bacterium]|nr:GMC family oxidoreductase [Actinomycetota bacterium]